MAQPNELKLAYSGNPIDADLINQILNTNGIQTIMKNQLMGTIAPWQVSPGGLDPVDIYVQADNLENALELVKEYTDLK